MTWETELACSGCGDTNTVYATGYKASTILFVGAHPGDDEIKSGRPFSGSSGGILRTELGRMGVDVSRIRMCNLWLHAPNKNEKCLQAGLVYLLKETKGKKLVVLFGAEPVKYLCDVSVEAYNGLVVTSSYINTSTVIIACIQPANVFKGTIGDVRTSLKKIALQIERMKLL